MCDHRGQQGIGQFINANQDEREKKERQQNHHIHVDSAEKERRADERDYRMTVLLEEWVKNSAEEGFLHQGRHDNSSEAEDSSLQIVFGSFENLDDTLLFGNQFY